MEIWDDVNVGETLPNHDGTFQKRVLLTVPPEERKKSNYTCEVYHQSSAEPYIKILDENLLDENLDGKTDSLFDRKQRFCVFINYL